MFVPAPSLSIAAQAPRYLTTCVPNSGSSCPPPVGDTNTHTGDVISGIDMALHRAAYFSGAIKDTASGADAQADVYIFDVAGQSVAGERHSGSYESPPLPAGTYYVMAAISSPYPQPPGTCQVYSAQRCPLIGESILDVAPTPVVLDYAASRSGVDFHLLADPVFANGFE